jgi:hypothetical protein
MIMTKEKESKDNNGIYLCTYLLQIESRRE